MIVSNPLADLLYANEAVAPKPYKNKSHKYARGMSITINNHKQDSSSIVQRLRKNYKSLMYGLTGSNPSMDDIKLWSGKRAPGRQKVMDIVANKGVLMVAAIHPYDHIDKYSGRGSKFNVDNEHLHLYIYGAHHYLPTAELELDSKINQLIKVLGRHCTRQNNYLKKFIDIKPVGTGRNQYNDIVSPTDVYDYINLPVTDPIKDCWINYMANCRNLDQPTYPLLYIYQEAQ